MNESKENILINMVRYKELLPLFEHLAEKRIPYAVVKGELLSMFAYGKLGQRLSGDIDILVSVKNIAKVKSGLLACGFDVRNKNRSHQVTAISTTNQSIPYYKKAYGIEIEIDINHDIFWGEYTGKRINIDEFLSDSIEMTIYGLRVKTISPLKAMVQLILHHYQECNSIYNLSGYNCISFNKFKDVYFLWRNNKEAISQDIYKLSYEYGIVPYVYNILYYTNKIFNDNDLGKKIKELETPEGIALLDCYGLTDDERKTWRIDFFTRLNTTDLFQFIKDDLTQSDFEKIKRAKEIFG